MQASPVVRGVVTSMPGHPGSGQLRWRSQRQYHSRLRSARGPNAESSSAAIHVGQLGYTHECLRQPLRDANNDRAGGIRVWQLIRSRFVAPGTPHSCRHGAAPPDRRSARAG